MRSRTQPPASREGTTRRHALVVLIPAVTIILAAFGGIYFTTDRPLLVFLDNLHWTTAYIAAAVLAWIGVRAAAPENRAMRKWFAWGLSAYAFGQVLWDIQVAVGWNPFPGPSDLFFLPLGSCCAMGLLAGLRAHVGRSQLRTVALDTGALSVAVLAVTLALYLPRRGDTGAGTMAVLVAYPLGLLTAACIGLILIPTLRLRPSRSWVTFLGGLIVNGWLWMRWNSLTLDNALQDGTLLNATFSVTALAMGVGALSWRVTSSTDPGWERRCEGMLRLLPLLVVMCAAIAVILGWTIHGVPQVVRFSVGAGAVAVAALALARQSLLLNERDLLLQAQHESEQRFRTLVENAPEAIVVFDVEKKAFEDVNENACRLFKLSRAEMMAKGPVELSPPCQPDGRSSGESAAEKIHRAVAGEALRFEWMHRDAAGADIPCEVYLTRLPSSTRTLIRGSIIDITERRRAEAALRRSEDLFRAIVEDQTEMIVRWKPDGTRTFVNPAYCRVFGKSYEELVGQSFYPLVAEEYHEAIRQKVRSLTPANPVATEIHESLSPTGERLWQEWTDRGLFDAAGQLVELQSTGRDITERKRTEVHIQHLNRVYAVLSDINQTIVRGKDRQVMLQTACQVAVEKGGFGLAWIGLEDEVTHRVKLVAHAGAAADTVQLVQAMLETEHTQHRCVITQHALRTGQHGICNNIEQTPEMKPWRDAARQRHYRAMASLPLKSGDKVTGLFNLYAAEVNFFDAEEMRLLDELAMDISFALEVDARETQRRQAEAALRNVLLHAHTIVMHNEVTAPADWQPDDSKWSVAHFGWETRVNDETAAQEVLPLEIPAGGSYATAWRTAIHHDDLAPMARVATQAFAAGATSWRQEFRCLDRAGRWHQFAQVASIETVAPGHWQVTTINTDITERKQAEEELRWKTALFEAQMDSTLDGLLVVNSQGRKIIQNRRMSEVWKIPRHIAENPDDAEQVRFVTDRTKDPAQFGAKVAYLYAHPDDISRDEIELVDGTVLDRYSAPVKDKTGNYYGRIWTFRDITERRKLEEQFRQSQKMEAIGQLSGGVAHDFNNILCVILGHTSLLEMGGLTPEEQTSALQQIAQAAERAANLTRQLLAFSRRQIMLARPLDLNETTTSMIKMLQRLIGEHIVLQTRYAPEAALVQADPGMIEQVLLNLVVNARDAMPGGGEIFIQTEFVQVDATQISKHPQAKAGRFVHLSVRDTGCGIAPEHLPRIFEPFFTTKEVGKGTGLGLATVFGIVEQHQGWVEVESTPGRGATFHIYLPKLETIAPAASQSVAPKVRGGTETILMVEDESALRALTRNALERYGYRVLEAANGPAALNLWRQNAGKIQLLLTDLVMPEGVSGRELAAKLHASEPQLKVIYMSGYPGDVAGQGLSLREGSNFLQKPFSPIKLAELVRTVLDAR